MVTEEALDQLEDTFRVFQRKCESDKKTMKTMVLASVEQLKIWIERADPIPRVIDLRYDAAANKHWDKETIQILLDLTDTRQKILI